MNIYTFEVEFKNEEIDTGLGWTEDTEIAYVTLAGVDIWKAPDDLYIDYRDSKELQAKSVLAAFAEHLAEVLKK